MNAVISFSPKADLTLLEKMNWIRKGDSYEI